MNPTSKSASIHYIKPNHRNITILLNTHLLGVHLFTFFPNRSLKTASRWSIKSPNNKHKDGGSFCFTPHTESKHAPPLQKHNMYPANLHRCAIIIKLQIRILLIHKSRNKALNIVHSIIDALEKRNDVIYFDILVL